MKTVEELTYLNNKKEYARDFKKIVEAKSNEYFTAETCENCGSALNMEYHHVLPLRFMGSNELTNIKRLCKKCHSNLHFGFKKVDKYIKNDPFEGIQLEFLFPEFMHKDCDSCKSKNNLKMRMVVPFSVGGQHTKGNLATLCHDCNHLLDLNTDDKGILNHSTLIKIGIENARKEGKHLGRPLISKKINNAIIGIYLLNSTVKEVAEHFGFSESTIYKYKREFDKKYIFEKINGNSFNLLDVKTKEVKHHYNINKHAA